MPGKRPRPFLRTSSIRQLVQSPPSPAAGAKKAPQRVVVGFDVGGAENSTKLQLDACESPRSVLEPDALSDPAPPSHQSARSPRSPRSVLDRLLSGPESQSLRKAGVGLGIVAALGSEEPAMGKKVVQVSVRSSTPIAITEQNSCVYAQTFALKEGLTSIPPSYHANVFSDVKYGADEDEEDHDQLEGVQGSIFCAASPFSNCCSLDVSAGDFLSVCAFCKCSLMPGKDIYMYRGDRAFCSVECRYQQIVIDELKERHPTARHGYPIVSPCSRFS